MGAHRAEMKLPTAALLVCCLCVSAVPLSYEESSVEDLIDEPPAGTGSDAGTAEEPPEGAALDTSEAGLKKAATANAVRDWWIAYTSDKSPALPPALPPAVSQKPFCTGRLRAFVLKRCA